MASPIQTRGFEVAERLNPQYADPRLLAPRYDTIIPALSQGLGAAQQFAQIVEDARMRPIRKRMAEIQLQDAEGRLGFLPTERELLGIRLDEAKKDAAVPRFIPGDIVIEDGAIDPRDFPAIDDNGERTGPMPVADLVRVENRQRIGPGGIITPEVVRTTIKTGEQRAAESEQRAATIAATKALAEQRGRDKTYESEALIQGYNDAVAAGDLEEAAMYKSLIDRRAMRPGGLPEGTVFAREVEKNAARIGLTMEQAQNLAATPVGASAMAKLAQQQALLKAGRSFIPASIRLTAAEQAAINGVEAPVAVAAAETVRAETPKGDVLARPKNKAEYDALPSGTKYVGPDGRTRVKK